MKNKKETVFFKITCQNCKKTLGMSITNTSFKSFFTFPNIDKIINKHNNFCCNFYCNDCYKKIFNFDK